MNNYKPTIEQAIIDLKEIKQQWQEIILSKDSWRIGAIDKIIDEISSYQKQIKVLKIKLSQEQERIITCWCGRTYQINDLVDLSDE